MSAADHTSWTGASALRLTHPTIYHLPATVPDHRQLHKIPVFDRLTQVSIWAKEGLRILGRKPFRVGFSIDCEERIVSDTAKPETSSLPPTPQEGASKEDIHTAPIPGEVTQPVQSEPARPSLRNLDTDLERELEAA